MENIGLSSVRKKRGIYFDLRKAFTEFLLRPM